MNDLDIAVVKAQAGEAAALSANVERLQDIAVGYAASLVSDMSTAEDVAREAFLQA